jgi:hypothetical protein
MLQIWFAELAPGAVPPLRNEWSRLGWMARALAWIHAQIHGLGLVITGPIEQKKTWSISSVMSIPTSGGVFYFKAVPPVFEVEPRLTAMLAKKYPGSVADVVAVEGPWMLMREFVGNSLWESQGVEGRASALRLLARIQVDLAGDTDRLLAIGCPDRRLERLEEDAHVMLDGAIELLGNDPNRPTAGLIDRVRQAMPRFREMRDSLAFLPATLLHGDFHAGNILLQSPEGDGPPLIYDWTDGALGCPFLDMPALFSNPAIANAPELRTPLRDAYLEAWADYGSPDHLIAAFETALELASLYHAVSYYRILLGTEPGASCELGGAIRDYLERLVAPTVE